MIRLLPFLFLLLSAGLPGAQEPDVPPAEEKRAEASAAAKRAIDAMRRRDLKSARAAWEQAVKGDPQNAAYLSNYGKTLYQAGQLEPAATQLERAVALKPALADSWITLGLVYADLKAPMRAISCLTRAVHENPIDPQAHNALGIVLKRAGWTAAAESELQKALDIEPKFSEAHFNLAVMYLERKPPALEMARRHYSAACDLGAAPDVDIERQLAGRDAEIEEVDEPVTAAEKKPEPEAVTPPAIPPDKSKKKPSDRPAKKRP